MTSIIEVKGISKKYNIIHQKGGYVTLRDVLTNIFKNPFSFLKTKTKEVLGMETKEIFWALKDVNFSVEKGEVIGIIGRNGAGKSTLLKILSQITPPTTGEIHINGTVGSLLEVGTGFHPELTGRENIFLNGAILGMKKKDIIRKFDEIVKFAGVEKFIDTPVKYYSSGMYVRLAFSVAAHMETDILIVDEVLAVGDAEFQKKCLGKMEDIKNEKGKTILFVSHNMNTIKQLCSKTMLLENGIIKKIGETNKIIDIYMKDKSNSSNNQLFKERGNTKNTILKGINIVNTENSKIIQSNDKLKILVKYDTDFKEPIIDGRFVITIINTSSQQIVLMLDSFVSSNVWNHNLKPQGEIICETDEINLTEGEYMVNINFLIQNVSFDYIKGATEFSVITDIKKYDYKNNPDKDTCHRLIKHSFVQKQ